MYERYNQRMEIKQSGERPAVLVENQKLTQDGREAMGRLWNKFWYDYGGIDDPRILRERAQETLQEIPEEMYPFAVRSFRARLAHQEKQKLISRLDGSGSELEKVWKEGAELRHVSLSRMANEIVRLERRMLQAAEKYVDPDIHDIEFSERRMVAQKSLEVLAPGLLGLITVSEKNESLKFNNLQQMADFVMAERLKQTEDLEEQLQIEIWERTLRSNQNQFALAVQNVVREGKNLSWQEKLNRAVDRVREIMPMRRVWATTIFVTTLACLGIFALNDSGTISVKGEFSTPTPPSLNGGKAEGKLRAAQYKSIRQPGNEMMGVPTVVPETNKPVKENETIPFEMKGLDLTRDFKYSLPDGKTFPVYVFANRYNSWPALRQLFEDWRGKLSQEQLRMMFPGTDGRPSYQDLESTLGKWNNETAKYIVESAPEPGSIRTALFTHNGIGFPGESLEKLKLGDIITTNQNGKEVKLRVVARLKTSPDVLKKARSYPREKVEGVMVVQGIAEIYEASLRESGASQQQLDDLIKWTSQSGIDFVSCESSGLFSGWDERIIISTVRVDDSKVPLKGMERTEADSQIELANYASQDFGDSEKWLVDKERGFDLDYLAGVVNAFPESGYKMMGDYLMDSQWFSDLPEEIKPEMERVLLNFVNPQTEAFPDGGKGMQCLGWAMITNLLHFGSLDGPTNLGGYEKTGPSGIVPEEVKVLAESPKFEYVETGRNQEFWTGAVPYLWLEPGDLILNWDRGGKDKSGHYIGHVVVVETVNGETLTVSDANGFGGTGKVKKIEITSQEQFDNIFGVQKAVLLHGEVLNQPR